VNSPPFPPVRLYMNPLLCFFFFSCLWFCFLDRFGVWLIVALEERRWNRMCVLCSWCAYHSSTIFCSESFVSDFVCWCLLYLLRMCFCGHSVYCGVFLPSLFSHLAFRYHRRVRYLGVLALQVMAFVLPTFQAALHFQHGIAFFPRDD
jgi:hypothetical protein